MPIYPSHSRIVAIAFGVMSYIFYTVAVCICFPTNSRKMTSEPNHCG